MKVSERSSPVLITADADEPLADAAERMRWNAVGALPVFVRHVLVGVLTERDVTTAVADGTDPTRTLVRDYMTPGPATVAPDADLADAIRIMGKLRVRHCPAHRREPSAGRHTVHPRLGRPHAGALSGISPPLSTVQQR